MLRPASGAAAATAPDVDVSGRSVKNPRVRAVHSDDENDAGSSAYFIKRDPYLAYQLGRNLNLREFRTRRALVRELPGLGFERHRDVQTTPAARLEVTDRLGKSTHVDLNTRILELDSELLGE